MNSIWDKLMVSVPIDRQAAIVTDWNRNKIIELEDAIKTASVSISLIVDIAEIVKKISLSTKYPKNKIFKLLAIGYGFKSWQELLLNCPQLRILNIATCDDLKKSAGKLRKENNSIEFSMFLEILSWYMGFKNWDTASAMLIPGPKTAKIRNKKRRVYGKNT
jgi:hypothetical protein